MQLTPSDTQAAPGDDRQWQLKWGAQVLLPAQGALKVRAFGQLEVGVRDSQRLADAVGTEEGAALGEATQARLKALAVQALQAALAHCDVVAFDAKAGACLPDCVAQVATTAAAALRAQLADLGFDLRAFVIAGCSYEAPRGAPPPLDGGEDSPGTWAIRQKLGLPGQAPPGGLGNAPGQD